MPLVYAPRPKVTMTPPLSLAPLLWLFLCAWPVVTARAQGAVTLTSRFEVAAEQGVPRPPEKVLADGVSRVTSNSGKQLLASIQSPPVRATPGALPPPETDVESEEPRRWVNYLLWASGFLLLLILAAAITFLLRYRLMRPRAYRGPVSNDFDGASVSAQLQQIQKTLGVLRRQQAESHSRLEDLVAQVAKNNDILRRGVTVISIHEESRGSSFSFGSEDGGTIRLDSQRPHRVPVHAHLYAQALASHRDLSNSIPVTPEPLYLDFEGARSIAGKLEEDNVYLSQVAHSQGVFVLFTDSSKSGWVFPNPKLPFRQAALKEVFPALTRSEFEAAKGNIEPKRVRKVEEGRWVVEQS